MREWFRGFVRGNAGKPLGAKAFEKLKPINEILAQDEAYMQIHLTLPALGASGHSRKQGLRLGTLHRWGSPPMLLLPIAEAMGKLVCEKDFTLVRNCDGPACTHWFHDTSKTHARRWCTMAVCGNRAKAAAHRARGGGRRQK